MADQQSSEATQASATDARNESASVSRGVQRVLDEYSSATASELTNHPLAQFIRRELPGLVTRMLGEAARGLIVKGSVGNGNWAAGPWLAILDRTVTTTAQSGYYVCLLFREDMKGVYLTLVQAMTEARRNYRSDAKTALRSSAAHYRALVGTRSQTFKLHKIDLSPSSSSSITSFYEAGVICAAYYESGSVPGDDELCRDLSEILGLYAELTLRAARFQINEDELDSPEQVFDNHEDASRRTLHTRIERNRALVKRVKLARGTTCEACGANFEELYGDLGQGYIEAHHLRPIATLPASRVELDPVRDFAVLCANCHRMIHLSEFSGDVRKFALNHLNRSGPTPLTPGGDPSLAANLGTPNEEPSLAPYGPRCRP